MDRASPEEVSKITQECQEAVDFFNNALKLIERAEEKAAHFIVEQEIDLINPKEETREFLNTVSKIQLIQRDILK